uniref:Large ribosomal subunit protein uL16 n=1 Tax=candidate division WOR-3 bacterium TaxID=2052148 RepID=A0A7C4XJM8_UNCW3
MLEPKKTKYRKQQRGRRKGKATQGNTIAFGEYGLVALEPAWITARQIEASRIAISHSMKKGAKMWVRIFPDKPVSKKPAETRMGRGKGPPEFWVSVVKPGRVLFEIEGVDENEAKELFRIASSKLPIKTRFVKREEGVKYEGF